MSGSVFRSDTIEPAIQPVLYGWNSEPAKRSLTASISDPILITMIRAIDDADFWIFSLVPKKRRGFW